MPVPYRRFVGPHFNGSVLGRGPEDRAGMLIECAAYIVGTMTNAQGYENDRHMRM